MQEIEQEVTAQATAIASVHKALAREAGDFAKAKEAEAKANGDAEGEKLWKEGGAAHVLLHTGLGLLTGNVAGAVGAAAASLAAPVLSEVQDGVTNILKDAGASDVVAKETGKIVASVTAAAGGAIVSGSPGAAAALNTEMFNRQLHHNEKELIKKKSNGDKETEERLTKAACYAVQCWAQFPEGSTLYQQNYVGSAEVASLSQEIQWVQQQKSDGYFNYTTFDKVTDAIAATTGLSSVNGKGTFNGEYINKQNSPRLPNACATAECAAGLPPNSTPEQRREMAIVFTDTLASGSAIAAIWTSGANAQEDAFVPVPIVPWIGVGGGINNSYSGGTAIEGGVSIPPSRVVSPAGDSMIFKEGNAK